MKKEGKMKNIEIRARVVAQEKGLYRVSNGTDELLAEVSGKFRYEAQTVSDYPAVGDYVLTTWPLDGSHAIIGSLFPRRSAFMRKAAGTGKQEQMVAANIDTVFVCMSLNNDFNLRKLERFIAASWDSGATPVIVLTKSDLCEDIGKILAEVAEVSAGVDVLTVSSLNNDFEAVKQYLKPGKTISFIGSSGVGKSTLINKLIGEEVTATGSIRSDDKGKHTTTHRELIFLPGDVAVIDTPGMREFGMWDSDEGIDSAFGEIEEYFGQCRFSDCSHNGELGCAIQRAIDEGEIAQSRWESYLKLKAENDYAVDGSAYLKAKKERFKAIAKMNRKRR